MTLGQFSAYVEGVNQAKWIRDRLAAVHLAAFVNANSKNGQSKPQDFLGPSPFGDVTETEKYESYEQILEAQAREELAEELPELWYDLQTDTGGAP